jgi:hypothetical protein
VTSSDAHLFDIRPAVQWLNETTLSPDRSVFDPAVREALDRQAGEDAHDLGLIVERLAWTPEQRLAASAAFLRFYQRCARADR